MTGTKEGFFDPEDTQGARLAIRNFRTHVSCLNTLSLESFAKQATDVSFIHSFSGSVKSGIHREAGWLLKGLGMISSLASPLHRIPEDESGERHLFLATSAKYPPRTNASVSGVPLDSDVMIAVGTNGEASSGVYSIDEKNESAGPSVVQILADHRRAGRDELLMKTTAAETKRALSS